MRGGYFVGFSPRAVGGRSNRTSEATFLDWWLQPDSPATGLPHFLLLDMLALPPAGPPFPLNSKPTPTLGSSGQKQCWLGLGGPSAWVPSLLCFFIDLGPGISALSFQ